MALAGSRMALVCGSAVLVGCHIRELLGPAVQPSGLGLALGQPPAEEVMVDMVGRPGDGQRPDAGEDLAGMRLGPLWPPGTQSQDTGSYKTTRVVC